MNFCACRAIRNSWSQTPGCLEASFYSLLPWEGANGINTGCPLVRVSRVPTPITTKHQSRCGDRVSAGTQGPGSDRGCRARSPGRSRAAPSSPTGLHVPPPAPLSQPVLLGAVAESWCPQLAACLMTAGTSAVVRSPVGTPGGMLML